MNEVTQLFVRHLERSPAVEAVEELVAALEAGGGDIQDVQVATYRYMSAIQQELLKFVATINVTEAAINLQD